MFVGIHIEDTIYKWLKSFVYFSVLPISRGDYRRKSPARGHDREIRVSPLRTPHRPKRAD